MYKQNCCGKRGDFVGWTCPECEEKWDIAWSKMLCIISSLFVFVLIFALGLTNLILYAQVLNERSLNQLKTPEVAAAAVAPTTPTPPAAPAAPAFEAPVKVAYNSADASNGCSVEDKSPCAKLIGEYCCATSEIMAVDPAIQYGATLAGNKVNDFVWKFEIKEVGQKLTACQPKALINSYDTIKDADGIIDVNEQAKKYLEFDGTTDQFWPEGSSTGSAWASKGLGFTDAEGKERIGTYQEILVGWGLTEDNLKTGKVKQGCI